ncbi:MAG: FAD-dependent oxidoreductase, partial [Bacilli bacterium]
KNKVNISVKGAFIAIGQLPKNDFLANTIDLTKNGYIQADENMATSTEGVFACGDCIDKKIRQLTTAVSDGTIAAINAVAYIDKI